MHKVVYDEILDFSHDQHAFHLLQHIPWECNKALTLFIITYFTFACLCELRSTAMLSCSTESMTRYEAKWNLRWDLIEDNFLPKWCIFVASDYWLFKTHKYAVFLFFQSVKQAVTHTHQPSQACQVKSALFQSLLTVSISQCFTTCALWEQWLNQRPGVIMWS